mmetsp:Transcript_14244/g.30717  ORF Transcript_14244/g.30717 Transcript_14244/m.30717 type:complete len:208 (+) Transcript_14244:1849-2472(+)
MDIVIIIVHLLLFVQFFNCESRHTISSSIVVVLLILPNLPIRTRQRLTNQLFHIIIPPLIEHAHHPSDLHPNLPPQTMILGPGRTCQHRIQSPHLHTAKCRYMLQGSFRIGTLVLPLPLPMGGNLTWFHPSYILHREFVPHCPVLLAFPIALFRRGGGGRGSVTRIRSSVERVQIRGGPCREEIERGSRGLRAVSGGGDIVVIRRSP